MMTTRPERLWTNEASWPNQPNGLIFTVPAVDRIGRQMFGAEWETAEFLEEADPLPPSSMDGVDRFWRNIVHRTLTGAHRSYEPSLGLDPRQQDQVLGPLGSGFSSGLATLGQLTVSEPGSRIADLGRQQDLVYLFTDAEWMEARRIIHDKNNRILSAIERNRAVARWIADNIIAGNIETFLIRLDSNETREGSIDAWYAVDIDRIVRRIRSCRMSPARPDDTKSGSHFIYFRLAGFEVALPGARQTNAQPGTVAPLDVGLSHRLDSIPQAAAASSGQPPTSHPEAVQLTRMMLNLHAALVEHFGANGGQMARGRERVSAASSWRNRQNPKPLLPSDLPRAIKHLDEKTYGFSKPVKLKG